MRFRIGFGACAGVSLLALASGSAFAQTPRQDGATESDEIVVTARFREERLQDVSTAITAFSGDDIANLGITDLAQLRSVSPGLDLADRGPNRKTPALRGVTRLSTLEDASISSPIVGIYLDDASVTGLTANQRDVNTFDMRGIEVLRGPQGTLYGDASMGGTIRYLTNQPALDGFGAAGQMGFSSTEDGGLGLDAALMVNLPLVEDRLGVRAVVFGDSDAGFIDNEITGEEDWNDSSRHGGRIIALFNATPNFDVSLAYHFDRMERGASWITDFPGDERVVTNRPGVGAARTVDEGEDNSDLYMLRANWRLGFANLTSITTRYERNAEFFFTDNQVAGGLQSALGLPFRPPATNNTSVSAEQWTQEFRLVSTHEGPFQYTLGAFYRQSDSLSQIVARSPFFLSVPGSTSDLFTSFPFEVSATQYSLFGEGSYAFDDRWTLRLGARYLVDELSSEQVTTFNPVVPFPPFAASVDLDVEEVLPRAVLEFTPSEDALLYLSASKGARNGGFNGATAVAFNASAGTPTPFAFLSDELWTYELGSKNEFFDNRLRLNGAIYLTDWSNPQTRLRGGAVAYFGNCTCDVQIMGLELDAEFDLTENLSVAFAAAYTDAQTEGDFVAKPAIGPFTQQIVPSGSPLPLIRDLATSIALNYSQPVSPDWNFEGSLIWSHGSESQVFFLPPDANDPGTVATQIAAGFDNTLPAFDYWNVRVGLRRDDFGIFAYVNNATDEDAYQYVAEGSSETSVSRPRTIGVTFTMNY